MVITMLKGLSLFANVGIAETYLSNVGINIVVANEIVVERANFYKHLYPNCDMITGDITDKNVYCEIINKCKMNDVEFIIATPPCQGMSLAGHKDPDDPRNHLITSAVSAIVDLKPKYALFENVTMQLKTSIVVEGKRILITDYVLNVLSNEYYISINEIDTKDYGVPQARKRAIILFTRKDQNLIWKLPAKEEKIITLKDAIGDLPSLDPILREYEIMYKVFPDYEKKKEAGLKISKWHYARPHVWRNVEVMLHTPTGCSAKKNKFFYPKNPEGQLVGGSGSTYMRMSWDKPAPTVTTYNHTISSFQNVHPGRYDEKTGLYSDPRVLSIFELMRVTTLPDDWNIPDWASENLIRTVIGEGIPPLAIMKIVKVLNLKEGC